MYRRMKPDSPSSKTKDESARVVIGRDAVSETFREEFLWIWILFWVTRHTPVSRALDDARIRESHAPYIWNDHRFCGNMIAVVFIVLHRLVRQGLSEGRTGLRHVSFKTIMLTERNGCCPAIGLTLAHYHGGARQCSPIDFFDYACQVR